MSNDIDIQVIHKTQEVLGKFIKKPNLTEKLLRKPPFRFLHDLVTNVIRETGFLKGLYSERELVSENVKEKDDKTLFLNTLIEATKAITGADLAVRSSKIIAGLEPVQTNLLLQAIGSALENKLDSSRYVNQLKTEKKSKSKSQTKSESNRKLESKEKVNSKLKTREDTKTKHDEKSKKRGDITPSSKNKTSKNIDSSNKLNKTKPESVRKSKDIKDNGENVTKTKSDAKKTHQKNLTPRNNVVTSEQDQAVLEVNNKSYGKHANEEQMNKKSVKERENISIAEEPKQLIKNHKENETNQNNNSTDTPQKLQGSATQDVLQNELLDTEQSMNLVSTREAPAERVKSARPKSGKLKREKDLQIENQKETLKVNVLHPTDASNEQKSPVIENNRENHYEHSVRPRSSLRPPSVRPSSARPGAPRLRNEFVLPEGEAIPLGKVKVIVESINNKEADEEETVTVQTAPEPEFQPPILQLPTDKGHLVEQILEQIHQDDVMEHAKSNVNIEWELDGLRSRNATSKEIEQLKTAIQTLTKTANPLGKLVNYLHEDIEAMHSELDMWTNSARQIMAEVANQKRVSNEFNKPLQLQLEETEESIAKHQQQIVSSYGNILRNEQRIRDLLIK